MVEKLILQFIEDSVQASVSGNISLDAQVRAYDLLDLILSGYVDRSAMSNELCKMRDDGLLLFDKNEFTLL